MSHLDTSYKLGSVQAIDDFESWVRDAENDNPTAAPSKYATILDSDRAVKTALQKLAEPKGKKVKPGSRKGGKSQPASRGPAGSGSRFKALKAKLSRKKGVKDPGALAASIGRSKFGKGRMASMAAKGE